MQKSEYIPGFPLEMGNVSCPEVNDEGYENAGDSDNGCDAADDYCCDNGNHKIQKFAGIYASENDTKWQFVTSIPNDTLMETQDNFLVKLKCDGTSTVYFFFQSNIERFIFWKRRDPQIFKTLKKSFYRIDLF